jgi:NADH-quinone oxidoreductase subunit H
MIPSLLTVAIIPFGSQLGAEKMVIANLNVGILYTFGIVSLGVYGIVLAGYAGNSKYAFLGGIRSSAQMISYEIPMGMSVVPLFMLVGGLRLGDVVGYQAGGWLHWLIFKQPLSFVIFLIALFAETNRVPFDLPESEQELAGGYNVEYSSMKFALFFLGEYANMTAGAGLMVTLFLGGWTLPMAGLDQSATTIAIGLGHIGIFLAKLFCVLFVMIWVRWMWPRFRYDQLMGLGWRRFVPLALANIVITAAVLWMKAK